MTAQGIKKAAEKDVCLACGWEDTGAGVCVTTEEAIRRDCARYSPSTAKQSIFSGVSEVVFSSTPRSPADFH